MSSARRPVRPPQGRSARLGLRRPERRVAPGSSPAPASRRCRGADLLATATALVVVVAGQVIGISVRQDSIVTGPDPAHAAYAATAMGLATTAVFRWLAAGIRPPGDRASSSTAGGPVQLR